MLSGSGVAAAAATTTTLSVKRRQRSAVTMDSVLNNELKSNFPEEEDAVGEWRWPCSDAFFGTRTFTARAGRRSAAAATAASDAAASAGTTTPTAVKWNGDLSRVYEYTTRGRPIGRSTVTVTKLHGRFFDMRLIEIPMPTRTAPSRRCCRFRLPTFRHEAPAIACCKGSKG